jgi:transcriptional regulator with XRE-family HTH domain
MSSRQLSNYLRTNRKRLALSQVDVAFLLGNQSSSKVSLYENFSRTPNLQSALALEAIYKRAASELFSGLYQQIEKDVAERAKLLMEKEDSRTAGQSARRREALAELARM